MSGGPDWGIGAYETFAPALEAPAAHLIQIAAPMAGERAVDLGCGSGNATLPLAAAGVQVTAIDPSLRLLGIATERTREAGFRITSSVARAEALPLPDGDADLIVSNFGVIFANDPAAAIAEVLRVLTPDGRFVFTAWLPRGPIADVGRLMREATSGGPTASPVRDPDAEAASVVWHDPTTFEHLIPGGAAAVTMHEAEAEFTADSPAAWIEQQVEAHPMWIAAREHISDDATWARVQSESVAVLAAGAVPGDDFAVVSPYLVVEVRPQR